MFKLFKLILCPSFLTLPIFFTVEWVGYQSVWADTMVEARCAHGGVTLYDHNNGGGRSVTVCGKHQIHNMEKVTTDDFNFYNYNDKMSSISGDGPITLWEDAYEGGRCIIIDPKGKGFLNLVDYGFDNKTSSASYGAFTTYGCKDYRANTTSNSSHCVSVDSKQGWQRFNLPGSFTKITSITGGWSVDAKNYTPVGASGHTGRDSELLTPYNQYKFDQRFPFGALLMSSGQGILWIQSPNSFSSAPFGAVDMRINDADNALGDNGGSIQVCFTN